MPHPYSSHVPWQVTALGLQATQPPYTRLTALVCYSVQAELLYPLYGLAEVLGNGLISVWSADLASGHCQALQCDRLVPGSYLQPRVCSWLCSADFA